MAEFWFTWDNLTSVERDCPIYVILEVPLKWAAVGQD